MKCALYLRVSTEDQTLETQRHELEHEAQRRGWEVVGAYAEKISGKARARKRTRASELGKLMHDASLKRFGVVLVWSLDRFGRSLLEVLELVQELEHAGCGFASLKESVIDTSRRHASDRLILAVLGAVAEFERNRLVERTRAGMAAAKRRGVHVGRPPLDLDPQQVAYVVKTNGTAFAARSFAVSRATIKRLCARARSATVPMPPPA